MSDTNLMSSGAPHARPGKRISRAVGITMCLLVVVGCASPARPVSLAGRTDYPAQIEVRPHVARPLNGVYEAEFISRFFGPIRTRITAEAVSGANSSGSVQSFKANTQPGVAWTLVGGFTGAVGQILAPFIFPKGMLLIWTSNLPEPADPNSLAPGAVQKPGDGRLGPSTLSKWQAKTLFRSEDLPVEIRVEESRTVALMTLRKMTADEAAVPFPKPDYDALAREYDTVFREHFMDPVLAASQEHTAFAADMVHVATHASDDLEFLSGCAIAWRNHSRLPIPAIYRKPDPVRCEQLFASVAEEQTPIVVTRDDASGIVTIEVIAFLDVSQVDAAFTKAIAMNPSAVILDLRNCPGFELAAFRAASWLLSERCDAGTLLGAQRRKEVMGDNEANQTSAARRAAAAAAPLCTMRAPGDIASLDAALERDRWARIAIEPVANPYLGPVMVLTSRRTFSTAEMLADVLKASGRVTLIGGRTGKRANLGRDRDLVSVPGWVCRVPSFEFIAADGDVVSQRGVSPDKNVPREEAKKVAVQLLLEKK